MGKINIEQDKIILLNNLIKIYQQEINAIYAIGVSWEQLSDEAKDKCAEDFDKAIISRETFLEELIELKSLNCECEHYEFLLFTVDQILLQNSILVKDLYGLDVKSFLNVKTPKSVKK